MVHQSDNAKIFVLLYSVVYAPPDYKEDMQKMFFKKNKDLYFIKDLPITKRLNTYIHHPTKWGSSIEPSGDTLEI